MNSDLATNFRYGNKLQIWLPKLGQFRDGSIYPASTNCSSVPGGRFNSLLLKRQQQARNLAIEVSSGNVSPLKQHKKAETLSVNCWYLRTVEPEAQQRTLITLQSLNSKTGNQTTVKLAVCRWLPGVKFQGRSL